MATRTSLWTEVTASEYDHERAALHFIRQRFPQREPFRAWSNFMFIADDGTRNEVDLLVVSPTGVYLVEIKSHPGRMDGDAGTWVWTTPEGYRRTFDNPLLLAERKAKKLKSLLMSKQAFRTPRMRNEGFYLKSVVFLSDPDLKIGLNEDGRRDIFGPDASEPDSDQPNDLPGIIRLFTRIDPHRGRQVDRPLSDAIAEAMDEAGIRESTTHRKIGQYDLGELLDEGEGWQDFASQHPDVKSTHRRVRVYLTGQALTEEERAGLVRAADREFRFLQGIEHPGIDRPLEFLTTPRGPALIFERDPNGKRLDHWLADHDAELDVLERIELVRDLAEAVRYAHRNGLYHRALAPHHIVVVKRDGKPAVKIRDWQAAARELTTSATMASGTQHVGDHVARAAHVYLAPETLRVPDAEPLPADIWSLGALAFLILSGKPPAADLDGLHAVLREQGHLSLAAAMDAPDRELDQVVRHATAVDATSRFVSVDELLDYLGFAVEEMTRPEEQDPLQADRGDILGGVWKVTRRVGTGSTSLILVAETKEHTEVLKVPRKEEYEDRLREEFEILQRLRHPTIIEPYGLETIGRRTVLRLEAASGTLADELRANGALSLDMLERFGGDILDALVFIDDEGISHRDIKPDNLGIAERGKDQERHLVLFDFSLSRSDPTDLRVGTAGYLDPFLEERSAQRWDEQAERYAAAVTLYEMATGTRPRWGDGSTDPALTDLELPFIDRDLIDAAVRDPLTEFFQKGLHRDPSRRFETAEQMRRAWDRVFRGAGRTVTEDEGAPAVADLDLTDVTRDTPIAELQLGPKVRNAIERLGLVRLGDLADFPPPQLVRLSGIGATTRREVNHLAQRLREQFEGGSLEAPAGIASVDRLAEQLVPKPPADEDHRTAVAAFLGLVGDSPSPWPTHLEAVEVSGLERDVVAAALMSARARWQRRPEITVVRRELAERLARRGGVAGGDELAALLLTERGSLTSEPLRSRRARAVVRASLEAESTLQQPKLVARRVGGAYLVALDGEVGDGDERRAWNADRLFDAAAALGEAAEDIVGRESLTPRPLVVNELRAIELPEGVEPFDDARLVRLAAAASPGVSVSTRLELYPNSMAPERAIEESRATLLDRRGLEPDDVRDRVRARFPDAAPLPNRPELDGLLEAVGLRWSQDVGVYAVPQRGGVLSTIASSTRHGTSFSSPDERDEAVREIEDRLDGFVRSGGFLALTVDPRRLVPATRQVASRAEARHVDLDRLLIDEMRTIVASAKNARWDRFLQADLERGERGWSVLTQVVDRAVPRVEEALRKIDGRVVLTGFGLLARYDHFPVLERLRDDLTRGRVDDALQGVVLVVPGDDPSARPMVDGRPIPIITANQWAHLPGAWLQSHEEGEAA
jgi:serine/threonine protein kinase